MKIMITLFLFLAFFLIQSNTYADKLLLDGINNEPPNSLEGIPRPRQGMTAKRVGEIFGKPSAVSDPIGFPAITRWQYEKFEVVYENDIVISTVLKKASEMFVSDQ